MLISFSLCAFRDLRPVSLEKGQETLRLRVYACYAWGGPLLVAGLAALLDHLPPQPQYTFLRPRFGEKQCWFYGKLVVSELSGAGRKLASPFDRSQPRLSRWLRKREGDV